MKPTRIIIFAKAPQPGFAKTRLIPALGAESAAELARQMLFNTLHEALAADIGAVELCVTPEINQAAWQGIRLPAGIEIFAQGEGDLGARLASASERALENAEPVLLIGTDCVEMSGTLLRAAAQALREQDVIIYCTDDGGYALLGLRKYSPFLFSDMPWSTDAVAGTTIARIGQLGWSVHVGQMLHDVDEPQDLKHLPDRWRLHVKA
ncbi:MAG: TIGR04282 family arsenosugar biosynthesis glycosyltransferase [Betaproteobacteria bacterium]|nr:TIGR04282 family arsenosugar biosynthesis glycosyltransferase [Betaproteobacteria bacterium]